MTEFSISWCVRLQPVLCPKDWWICSIILEIGSQTEYTNQKHRTAKHILPFQIFEVRLPLHFYWTHLAGLPLQIQYFNFLCVLIEKKPAHTSDRHQWSPWRSSGLAAESCRPAWSLDLFKISQIRLVKRQDGISRRHTVFYTRPWDSVVG